MSSLDNKTCIVTGASKGFGLAISKSLLAAGANVGMLARDNETLQQAVAELGSDRAMGFSCDVAKASEVKKAFAQVKKHFGSLNAVINNAGMARPASVENIREDELLLQVNTNFVGTVLCCQAAIPLLRGEDNPRIINISSASAWHYDEMLHLPIYASTKAAYDAWRQVGSTMDSGMEVEHVARAIVHSLSYPAGVAVDLLEVRPNTPVPK